MDMLLVIVFVLLVSILNIVCFFIGAKVGQKVDKGEEIKMPTISPVALYKEHKEKQEVEKRREKLDVIRNNIEIYDGTEKGQEDVPE